MLCFFLSVTLPCLSRSCLAFLTFVCCDMAVSRDALTCIRQAGRPLILSFAAPDLEAKSNKHPHSAREPKDGSPLSASARRTTSSRTTSPPGSPAQTRESQERASASDADLKARNEQIASSRARQELSSTNNHFHEQPGRSVSNQSNRRTSTPRATQDTRSGNEGCAVVAAGILGMNSSHSEKKGCKGSWQDYYVVLLRKPTTCIQCFRDAAAFQQCQADIKAQGFTYFTPEWEMDLVSPFARPYHGAVSAMRSRETVIYVKNSSGPNQVLYFKALTAFAHQWVNAIHRATGSRSKALNAPPPPRSAIVTKSSEPSDHFQVLSVQRGDSVIVVEATTPLAKCQKGTQNGFVFMADLSLREELIGRKYDLSQLVLPADLEAEYRDQLARDRKSVV